MLLSSSYAPPQPQRLSPPYPQQQSNMLAFPQPQDGMWNDIEAQLSSMPAPSTNPSLSKRASTQRPPAPSTLQRGNSMRIVKPSQSASTHNSPLGLGLGSKAGLGRRMTVMGDTSGYRRRRLLEATAAIGQQQQQIIQQQAAGQSQARMRGTTMSAQRPMSWCPTMSSETMGTESWNGSATQQQGEAILRKQAAQYSPESQLRLQQLQQWQQLQMVQSQQVAQQQARIQQAQQMQMQAAQQAQAEQNYFALDTGMSSQNQTPYFSQQNTPLSFPTYTLPMNQYYDNSYGSAPMDMPNTFPAQQNYNMGGMYSNLNLGVPNSFGMASTTPPTPETFPMADQYPVYVNTQEQGFSLDQEEEGEVLVGLGLYSQPEKTVVKTVAEPHIIEMYARAGVPISPEMAGEERGKGLKLEETWEPPKDEESEEDGEGDADGEEEEEDDSNLMPPPQVPMVPQAGWL